MLLPGLDCNQCSVITSCMRETVIVDLMVFMCKLNKAKNILLFFLKFGYFKILVGFVLKLTTTDPFPLLHGDNLSCATFLLRCQR